MSIHAMAIILRSLLFLALLLLSTAAFAETCNPNVPSYSQPGCTEATPQTPSYTPPTSTTPYSPPTSPTPSPLPTEGPSWKKPSETDHEGGDTTTVQTNPKELLNYVQKTLRDIPSITKKIDTHTSSLKFFSIDQKKLKAEISKRRSSFQEIERLLKEDNTDAAEQQLEKLDDFVGEAFVEALDLVKQAHSILSTLPNKEVKSLLVAAFKPVRESIMDGEASTAIEILNVYVDDLKKNKKLYATKKLTAESKKTVRSRVKALEKKLATTLNEIEGEESEEEPGVKEMKEQMPKTEARKEIKKVDPVKIEEIKKVEVKKPTGVDTKKISDDTRKINDAIQRSIQNDAQNRVWNLYQNIRY